MPKPPKKNSSIICSSSRAPACSMSPAEPAIPRFPRRKREHRSPVWTSLPIFLRRHASALNRQEYVPNSAKATPSSWIFPTHRSTLSSASLEGCLLHAQSELLLSFCASAAREARSPWAIGRPQDSSERCSESLRSMFHRRPAYRLPPCGATKKLCASDSVKAQSRSHARDVRATSRIHFHPPKSSNSSGHISGQQRWRSRASMPKVRQLSLPILSACGRNRIRRRTDRRSFPPSISRYTSSAHSRFPISALRCPSSPTSLLI